ncbi:MAG: hypothetical protein LBB94_07595 [Clostridiales bacterium]|jgi:hypothetical protein|nr:hypothetical protein [Clostridiales bacterium]
MNNEEKILAMLDTLIGKVDKLESGQAQTNERLAQLESGQSELKITQAETRADIAVIAHDVKAIWEQTAHLTEFEAEMRLNAEKSDKRFDAIAYQLDDLTNVTKDNTFDIARLKHRAV